MGGDSSGSAAVRSPGRKPHPQSRFFGTVLVPSTCLSYSKLCRRAPGCLVEAGAIRPASGKLLRFRSGWETVGYPQKPMASIHMSPVRGIRELDTHMVDEYAEGIYVARFRGLRSG